MYKSNSKWTITNMAKVRKGGLSDNAATALLTEVTTKAAVLWYVTLRDVVEIYRRFGESTAFIFRVQQSKKQLLSRWTCYALRRIVSYLPIDMVHSRRRQSKTLRYTRFSRGATAPSEPGSPHYGVFTIADNIHPVGLLWTRDQPVATTFKWQQALTRDIHAPGGIRTRNPSKPAAVDPRLRPRGHPNTHANEYYATVK